MKKVFAILLSFIISLLYSITSSANFNIKYNKDLTISNSPLIIYYYDLLKYYQNLSIEKEIFEEKEIISSKYIIYQNIIPREYTKDICFYIYNIKDITKYISYKDIKRQTNILQKQYVFLLDDNDIKKQVEKCYDLFSLTKEEQKIVESRIIYFNPYNYKPLGINSVLRYKEYKEFLIKNNVLLKVIYNKKYILKEKYYQHLFNIFVKETFPKYDINRYKDFIVLSYKDYRLYNNFKKILNQIVNVYMDKRKSFFQSNKKLQNTNPRTGYINYDREKCAVYTLSEISVFNDYLINVLTDLFYDYSKEEVYKLKYKSIIDNLHSLLSKKYYKNLLSINNYNKYFNKYSEYYVNTVRPIRGVGMTEEDMIKYYNGVIYSNNTLSNKILGYKNKGLKLKYISYLYNPIIHNINVDIKIKNNGKWIDGGHIGLEICNLEGKCMNYWPDLGYTKSNKYLKFYGKKRDVYTSIWFNILTF